MGKYNLPAIAMLTLLCGGCTLCPNCDPDAFAAYGGRWERTDRDHGRVGSLFAPAGAQIPYGYDPGEASAKQAADAPSAAADDKKSEDTQDSVLEPEQKSLDEQLQELRNRSLQDYPSPRIDSNDSI
jgi:hypothetical protein